MSVEINETNFQNAVFRQFVSENYDVDDDGWLSDEEIAAVTSMALNGISGLGIFGGESGLLFFTSLSSIEITNCSGLTSFSIAAQELGIESIRITSCEDLTYVTASLWKMPSLRSLTVINCQKLKTIQCYGASPDTPNMLGDVPRKLFNTLTITNCPAIEELRCTATQITSINLSGLSKLAFLDVRCTSLTSLDLSDCTSLERLDAWNCNISQINFGSISNLCDVYLYDNNISELAIPYSANLNTLAIGKNSIQSFDVKNCPRILEVLLYSFQPDDNGIIFDFREDDPPRQYAYPSVPPNIEFDSGTLIYASQSSTTGIEINETNFPDAGFRSYISENFDTDNDGWLSDSELANMASIDISEKNDIFSLQGIGLIGTLKALSVNKCSNIASISIVGHPSLEDLRIYSLSSLATVTLTDNLLLNYTGLWASLNLATITIQNCPELKELWCGTFDTQSEYYSYSLSSLTLSGVPKLERLWIQKGQLTYLDVSACTSLKNFRAYSNDLTAINFGNIQSLELIAVYDNGLTSLTIPPSSVAQQISCYQNSITSVDVSRSPVLVSAIKQNTPSQMTITGNPTRYGSSSCHIIVDPTVIVLLAQPMSRTEDDGDSVTFSVEAKGENLAYQWQVSHDGSTWSDLAGATESTCSRVASETTDGDQYRCKITDGNGNSVISQAATLTLRSAEDPQANLVITRQPASQTAAAGSSVTFSIEAQGNGLTYRWEYCLPNTQNWIYADGDSSSITIPNVDSDHNGVQYRCIVTDGAGNSLASGAATITVTSSDPGTDPDPGDEPTPGDQTFEIIRQPKNTTAISGAEATFSVVAQGTDLSYQWQFSSDSGSSWLDVQSDGQSNAYTFTVGDAQNGYLFRCVIAQGTETLTTDSVRLTVRELPSSPERRTYLPSEMADAIRQLGLAGIDLDDIPFGNMSDGLAITTLGSRGATSPEWYEEIAEAINVLKTGIDIEDYQIFKVKTITENGEYAAVEDDCYGFSLVDVDVFGGDSIVDRTVSEPYINDKITKVGAYAFCKCDSLPAVDVPNCANIWGWAFSGCTSLSFVSAPNCSMVGSNAFEYCVNLLSISLPNCKTLSDYAFSNCRSLALVSSPLCEIIGDGAFQGCTSLTSVEFPMCGTIGNDAFNACTRLVLADFPVCGNVGVRAFQNCTWLMSVSLPNCSVVGVETFKYCSGLLSIEFPLCTSIGSSAFLSCTSLAEVSFPECTNIGAYAFYKCFSLAYASFSLCTFIGQSAFGQCSSMSYADFPVCSSIGSYAFSSCTNLASANFPLCTIVPGGAFYKCERLSYVSIPNCSQIGSSAFYSCHDLLAISLPNCSIIGSNAFYSCSNLSALYLYGSSMCKLAASNALYSTAIKSGRGWIYVPESLYSSYIYATNWSYYGARFSHTVNVRATMSGTTLSLSGAGVVMSNNVLSLSAATVSMSSTQLVFP